MENKEKNKELLELAEELHYTKEENNRLKLQLQLIYYNLYKNYNSSNKNSNSNLSINEKLNNEKIINKDLNNDKLIKFLTQKKEKLLNEKEELLKKKDIYNKQIEDITNFIKKLKQFEIESQFNRNAKFKLFDLIIYIINNIKKLQTYLNGINKSILRTDQQQIQSIFDDYNITEQQFDLIIQNKNYNDINIINKIYILLINTCYSFQQIYSIIDGICYKTNNNNYYYFDNISDYILVHIIIPFKEKLKELEQNETFKNLIQIDSKIKQIEEIIEELKEKDKIKGGYYNNDKYRNKYLKYKIKYEQLKNNNN